MMGHLNSFSASGGGNLNKNFAKNTNARGLPGGWVLKLRFYWYINLSKLDFASEEGHSGCKSQNIAIRALKGNVLCQICFKWTY